MCGFTGYFNLNNALETNNQVIREMIAIQKHRGPDDSGIVGINTKEKNFEEISSTTTANFSTSKDLLFGFNRLSILDLSPNGHQPMISPDKKVILMMNGEVYNAFDFKDDLISKGHTFKSTSDTEVVLHLYLEYGIEKMVKMLNGMFALAIYDFTLDSLFLVRDRFGIKPLYILQEENRIAFASEMKSFKPLPNFKFEADFSRMDEFLLFRNLINTTLFKNIVNCTPGTYLKIKNGTISSHTFYDINSEGNQIITSNEKEVLEKALQKSVSSQMISDVKLGCQLSGGVDSSLVTYFAAQNVAKGNLETISITFKNPNFSEEKYIDYVAEQLSLKAHKYEMEATYYFDVLEKAIWHFEHPLNHPNTIGIYLLSEQAKKHVTVLLSGEGADESLAGYSRFIRAKENKLLSKSFFGGLKRNKNSAIDYLSYALNPDKKMIMETAFGSVATAKALRPSFKLSKAIIDRNNTLKKVTGETCLRQRKYELLTYLPDLLMRQDKMSMAHSIENRVPFLDNEMVTTSLNISGDKLIAQHNNKLEGKKVLKDICAEKFDEKFAYRDKMGFGIPLREFMTTQFFQNKWQNEIEPNLKKRNQFQLDVVSSWVKNIKTATPEQLDAIWLLLGFEVWAKQYLD
ncbi:MAG: asparagine synthase (glutamine-hydrolyzing) [Flavobacterium sp.]|jgi:asparagine synthase (glutamine-hydrolysing)|uniref:asparagine synthase (glutamine-hydrolyzing) n=1 Tax=Flavobacterium TaxID=237 RepID=UPI0022C8DDBE|nr:asparagine synthase (glutamine-hydrolyzing) [Flavobacterium sp.]MCZ8330798.1 asparagine synthase (glutamine-hydrolyzing) [Flavobacterium sp.]